VLETARAFVNQSEKIDLSNKIFRAKNALDVWKHKQVWEYIFYNEARQM